MNHTKQRNRSEALNFISDKIEELNEDELIEDILMLVISADKESREVSLCGNGCPVCFAGILNDFIKKKTIKHTNHD